MNIEYIDAMEEIQNKYGVELENDEKVVFTANLNTFGDERGISLGRFDSEFTLTNKRIIANNGVGIWTINIAEDIVSCKKVDYKHFFGLIKGTYFAINLNHEVFYGEKGKQKLTGFQFYFKESNDIVKFEKIVNNVFN